MTNFKGTKGKWKLATNYYGYYTSVRNIDDTRKVCVSRVNDIVESNANMLLISKAPEMLETLKECMRVLSSVQSPATPSILLYREIEKLIKEATEL